MTEPPEATRSRASSSAAPATRSPAQEGPAFTNYELKFTGERWRTSAVRRWLRHACAPDADFPEGTVYTVYYDTPALDCLHEKLDSDYLKTKIRLRWYRVGGRFSSSAYLEVKSRCGSRRGKARVPVPFQRDWPTAGMLDVPSIRGALRRLRPAGIVVPDDYRPVLLVRYRRHRFVEPLTGSRCCLDRDICVPAAGYAHGTIPSSLPLPTTVFEIKGRSDRLPERLAALATLGFRRSSFSKYAACYNAASMYGRFAIPR